MFTNTGIHDKQFIHLSQFVGLFIRPENFLQDVNLELELEEKEYFPYPCSDCSEKFSDEHNLVFHERQCHEDIMNARQNNSINFILQ